jgi:hypothetical protein
VDVGHVADAAGAAGPQAEDGGVTAAARPAAAHPGGFGLPVRANAAQARIISPESRRCSGDSGVAGGIPCRVAKSE